jgi:lipopolysaccharide heptosyltransferase I
LLSSRQKTSGERAVHTVDFKRILIIKPSSLGDVIHALPVLKGLRHRYPDARISWLISTACADLLAGHPDLDEIIPFDRKRYGRIGRDWAVTWEFVHFVRGLRARGFDLVLDLQGLFRSGFLAWASGARTRLGFAGSREFAWLFYTRRITVPGSDVHAVDRYYLLAEVLGFADVPITFDLPVDPEARLQVERLLAAQGVDPGRDYVVIAPGTRWETKRWPTEHFVELVRRLSQETGVAVVLAGSPDEAALAEGIAAGAGVPVANVAGRTTLPQMVALVDGAAAVVMNDTGPMHLAAALDKPMIALFGPTNPQRTGPYRRGQAVLRADVDCAPCYLKRLADCPYSHRCMRALPPERVVDRVRLLLCSEAVR